MARSSGRAFSKSCGVVLVAIVVLVGGAAAAWGAKSEVLIANGVIVLLEGRLPDGVASAETVPVVQEKWDAGEIARVFRQEAAPLELPEDVTRDGEAPWLRLDDGSLVRLGAARAGFYLTAPGHAVESTREAACDASRAVEIARGYVRDHGGMPGDAALWGVREVTAVGLSLSEDPAQAAREESRSRRSTGYYVEFRHSLGGMLVDSPDGGDCIKVRVDSIGEVRAYGRTWRTAREGDVLQRETLLGAREALASGLVTGGSRVSKGRIAGTVRLRDARLVYLAGSRNADVRVLRPAWRYVLDTGAGSQRVFVDARTGRTVREE